MTMTEISNHDDFIYLRDITDRVDELNDMERDEDETAELATLTTLLDDMKGCGGDHQWEGDWYPQLMIRDYHFEDYAQELAEDIGAINHDAPWPQSFIDWPAAAEALKIDYSEIDFDGVTYWYR